MTRESQNDKCSKDTPGEHPGSGGHSESEAPRRCKNCYKLIFPEEVVGAKGGAVCPHCKLPIDEVHLG